MIIEGLVLIGDAPILTVPKGDEISITLKNNHFIEWGYLSWWKKLLLKMVGIHKITGRGLVLGNEV